MKSTSKKTNNGKLIYFILSVLSSFLVFTQIINHDIRQTASNLCDTNNTYNKYSSICSSDYYRGGNEFGSTTNPKHFFLSDFAFRHIFVNFGYDLGTNITVYGGNENSNDSFCDGIKDSKCISNMVAVDNSVRDLNKRNFILFLAWFTVTILLLREVAAILWKRWKKTE